jgi:hypothetical protein
MQTSQFWIQTEKVISDATHVWKRYLKFFDGSAADESVEYELQSSKSALRQFDRAEVETIGDEELVYAL